MADYERIFEMKITVTATNIAWALLIIGGLLAGLGGIYGITILWLSGCVALAMLVAFCMVQGA